MFLYKDIISGDELLSDAFPHTKIVGGMIWEVESKYVELVEEPKVNVGANPSIDMKRKAVAKERRGSSSTQQAKETVPDIVKNFKLKEQTPLDEEEFVDYIKVYNKSIKPMLDEEKQQLFKYNKDKATRYLLNQLRDHLNFYAGESYVGDKEQEKIKTYVFSYYKEGKNVPTFLYLSVGLREEKA